MSILDVSKNTKNEAPVCTILLNQCSMLFLIQYKKRKLEIIEINRQEREKYLASIKITFV
jgi:hypothetical protein